VTSYLGGRTRAILVTSVIDSEFVVKGLRKSIYDHEPLRLTLSRQLDLPEIESVTVDREAVDARRRSSVVYVYNLRFRVSHASARLQRLLAEGEVLLHQPKTLSEPERRLSLPERPVIIGFGPAGMFAGLALARLGYRPVICDRGEPIEDRVRTVGELWREGKLDPDSNLQFGEGGAGTFSDGKLTAGKRDPLNESILRTFVEAGAPKEILYQGKPHIGSDRLRPVVQNLRRQIESMGGEVHFGHTFSDLRLDHGTVKGIIANGRSVSSPCVILAMGHSARDTVEMLHRRGVGMDSKPFAVGVRIEHPAWFINQAQYGQQAAAVLPAADYRLAHRHGELGVYTFCMCPGGRVVCASSEPGQLVTNGMSLFARGEEYSNSAIVVSINPAAHGFRSPLEAIAFQRRFEELAFTAGGGGYCAPAQRARDFMRQEPSSTLPPATYEPGLTPADLNTILPPSIIPALRAGLAAFDRKLGGFVDNGVLIGFESRTSSPVRILRNENYESMTTPGLYLLGEGAGYAGGIMTCALDAVRFVRLVQPWQT